MCSMALTSGHRTSGFHDITQAKTRFDQPHRASFTTVVLSTTPSCTAHTHTKYTLYVNAIMRGEIQWQTHLYVVGIRHDIQQFTQRNCHMCTMPLSTSHAIHSCPLQFLTTWHFYVKLCLMIPSLNPCWHRCIPTPWGVPVKTTKGLLLLSDQDTRIFRFPYERFHFSVTGEFTSQSVRIATEHGAIELMLVRLLGSTLTTWYNIQQQDSTPLPPIDPNFVMPRNPYGLVAHVLTLSETLQCSWAPWMDDAIIWPSSPLLFHISNECRVNVLLPHL